MWCHHSVTSQPKRGTFVCADARCPPAKGRCLAYVRNCQVANSVRVRRVKPSDEWTGTGAESLTQGSWESLCSLRNRHVSVVSTVPATGTNEGSALEQTHRSNIIGCFTGHVGPDRTFGTELTFRTCSAAAGAGRKADHHECVRLDADRLTPKLQVSARGLSQILECNDCNTGNRSHICTTTSSKCLFPGHT